MGFGGSEQEWGYVTVRPSAHMFWWLYYTTSKEVTKVYEKPLLIWLQGGPGASSTGYGNFKELGPLDLNFKPRNFSWVILQIKKEHAHWNLHIAQNCAVPSEANCPTVQFHEFCLSVRETVFPIRVSQCSIFPMDIFSKGQYFQRDFFPKIRCPKNLFSNYLEIYTEILLYIMCFIFTEI